MSEEAFKLFRALSSSGSEATSGEPHVCTASWCPVCQVVGFVRDNPEALAQVSTAAASLAKSLRDLVDSAVPRADAAPEDESA